MQWWEVAVLKIEPEKPDPKQHHITPLFLHCFYTVCVSYFSLQFVIITEHCVLSEQLVLQIIVVR